MTQLTRLDGAWAEFSGGTQEQFRYLYDRLAFFEEDAEHKQSFQSGQWDGVRRLMDWSGRFPAGLMLRAERLIRESPLFKNEDLEVLGRDCPFQASPESVGFGLRDYQEAGIRAMLAQDTYGFGIGEIATGGGKTRMAIAAIKALLSAKKDAHALFIVTTQDIREQSVRQINELLGEGWASELTESSKMELATPILITTAAMLAPPPAKAPRMEKGENRADFRARKARFEKLKLERTTRWLMYCKELFPYIDVLQIDECLTGDTLVLTDIGPLRMDQIPASSATMVVTYDGHSATTRRIRQWVPKGKRPTLRILTLSGRMIQCTKEHPFATAAGNWVPAGSLTPGVRILSLSSGCLMSSTKPLPASAAAANASGPRLQQNTTASPSGTISSRKVTALSLPLKSPRQFLEHCLEMLRSCIPTGAAGTRASRSTTPPSSGSGPNTSSAPCTVSTRAGGSGGTRVMARNAATCARRAFQAWCQSWNSFVREAAQNPSPGNGWSRSAPLALPGGSGMMVQTTDIISACTPKGSPRRRTCSSGTGSRRIMGEPHCSSPTEGTAGSLCARTPQEQYGTPLDHSSQAAWKISSDEVVAIEQGDEEEVYDIEVEGTHCFFANGMLVHNCHHAGSESWYEVCLSCTGAYWRHGWTGTAFREDGSDLLLEAACGPVRYAKTADELVKEGYLVRPSIFMVRTPLQAIFGASYREVYDMGVVMNEGRNLIIKRLAQLCVEQRRHTLLLVKEEKHGNLLSEMLEGKYPFVTGKMAKGKRSRMMDAFRDKKFPLMIATTLADEGLDIPAVDTLITAGGGKSDIKAVQRPGRIMRLAEGKRDAIVFDFEDSHNRMLAQHSRERAEAYSRQRYPVYSWNAPLQLPHHLRPGCQPAYTWT